MQITKILRNAVGVVTVFSQLFLFSCFHCLLVLLSLLFVFLDCGLNQFISLRLFHYNDLIDSTHQFNHQSLNHAYFSYLFIYFFLLFFYLFIVRELLAEGWTAYIYVSPML